MVRELDKADAMLTLSSAVFYNIESHLPFLRATAYVICW